jgi:metallo-beta-lactamase family protein
VFFFFYKGHATRAGPRPPPHVEIILPNPKATLLVVGYQAAGSLGRRLIEGAKEVTIQGEKVPVRCTIETMYGYSAHMDGEQLLEFVSTIGSSLQDVFVVMGEPSASNFLAQRIRDYLGLRAIVPTAAESVDIEL